MTDGPDERMRRWRLVLGEAGVAMPLDGGDARVDAALGALYDSDDPADDSRRADCSCRSCPDGVCHRHVSLEAICLGQKSLKFRNCGSGAISEIT